MGLISSTGGGAIIGGGRGGGEGDGGDGGGEGGDDGGGDVRNINNFLYLTNYSANLFIFPKYAFTYIYFVW